MRRSFQVQKNDFHQCSRLIKMHIRSLYSTYQVVVEEETGKKVKRELGVQECFPLPMSHGEAQARGTPHYYTAELPPSSLPEASPFTVGDNHTYNGYWNSPLDPRKSYLVYFQAMSNFRGVSDYKLALVLQQIWTRCFCRPCYSLCQIVPMTLLFFNVLNVLKSVAGLCMENCSVDH